LRLATLRIRQSNSSLFFTLRAYTMAFTKPHTR
jgi:hypothetical protein